jgi:hypothetical protein
LRVSLDERRAAAADLDVDVAAPQEPFAAVARARHGWLERLRLSSDPSGRSVSGLGRSTFGWFFGDLAGGARIARSYAMHALVRVPEGLGDLSGTLRVDATVARPRITLPGRPALRVRHARSGRPLAFTVLATGAQSGQVAEHLAETAPGVPAAGGGAARPSAVRLCVAADVERYSRFRNPEALRAQQRFVELLARARAHAGVAEADVELQQSGDGQFAVLPTGIDESAVIPAFVEGVGMALAETNADLNERARLRIRVALWRGHVARAVNGFVGEAPVAVHRILDSPAARDTLAANPRVDFVLIVPDMLYQDVIMHCYDRLPPARFREVLAEVPAKDFTERAWVYVPPG